MAALTTATANRFQKTLIPSSITTHAARSRRRIQIKASVSTFPDAIRDDSRNSALSLYEILRVNPCASQVEIKTAYRSLAKVYHPDAMFNHDHQQDDDEEQSDGGDFIEIHNAYETLSDPAARARPGIFIGEPLDIQVGIIRPEDGKLISAGEENGKMTRFNEPDLTGYSGQR
ncbi:unnamed protein product [Dovyalis caffra]|uniref:J domain-containing protein n=1 Tax=Dovyalis caffra TaxID=77055 RepID=A0AAV1QQ41_9ROSI|nr:unnamed protein product [Dovyalis caffra]